MLDATYIILFICIGLFFMLDGCLFMTMKIANVKSEAIKRKLIPYSYGGMGVFFAILIYAILAPQYVDYSTRAQASEWLNESKWVREEIQKRIAKNDFKTEGINFSDLAMKFSMDQKERLGDLPYIKIDEYGQIMFKGTPKGQLLILTPRIDKNARQIKWECMGGRSFDMPIECRFPSPEGNFLK